FSSVCAADPGSVKKAVAPRHGQNSNPGKVTMVTHSTNGKAREHASDPLGLFLSGNASPPGYDHSAAGALIAGAILSAGQRIADSIDRHAAVLAQEMFRAFICKPG